MKMEIPNELVGAVNMVLQSHRKIECIEQEVDNAQLAQNIMEMADALMSETWLAKLGKAKHEDVQANAAALGAHALRMLINYNEMEAGHEK